MEKGNDLPAFAALRSAQTRHERAVADYQEATRLYTIAVNALQLPTLMQGPVVRATDMDTIANVRTVLELAEEMTIDFLIWELENYRAERDRLAAWFGISVLAEVVAITAAAVAKAGRSGQ